MTRPPPPGRFSHLMSLQTDKTLPTRVISNHLSDDNLRKPLSPLIVAAFVTHLPFVINETHGTTSFKERTTFLKNPSKVASLPRIIQQMLWPYVSFS